MSRTRSSENQYLCDEPDDLLNRFQASNPNTNITDIYHEQTHQFPRESSACETCSVRRWSRSHSMDINLRSTCPWTLELIHFPGQYPANLVNARCCCRNCMSGGRHVCEPIFNNIRVLERTGCQNGVFIYTEKWQQISIGCTCARRRTRHFIQN